MALKVTVEVGPYRARTCWQPASWKASAERPQAPQLWPRPQRLQRPRWGWMRASDVPPVLRFRDDLGLGAESAGGCVEPTPPACFCGTQGPLPQLNQHAEHATVPSPSTVPPLTAHPANASGPQPWHAEVWQRMRCLFWLKLLGISAFMWVFFVGYFHTLRHPVRAVQEMPLTALDHVIGLQPAMLVAYVSLWVYVGLAPGLLRNLRELLIYGLWIAALCLCGLLIFHFYPTAVPKPLLPVDVARHPGFALLHGVDAAGNACPSLHVATALFTALWVQRLFAALAVPRWLRAGNLLWVLLIVYSTLAIKQHVVLDALAGAVLGGAFAWASMRWFSPVPSRHPEPPSGG